MYEKYKDFTNQLADEFNKNFSKAVEVFNALDNDRIIVGATLSDYSLSLTVGYLSSTDKTTVKLTPKPTKDTYCESSYKEFYELLGKYAELPDYLRQKLINRFKFIESKNNAKHFEAVFKKTEVAITELLHFKEDSMYVDYRGCLTASEFSVIKNKFSKLYHAWMALTVEERRKYLNTRFNEQLSRVNLVSPFIRTKD